VPIPFDAVIFDLDGLMLDTESIARICWQNAGRDLGYEVSDELFLSFVGRTAADSSRVMQEKWGKDFPLDVFRKQITLHWNNHIAVNSIPLKAGLIELLDFLDSVSIRKAIATSTYREGARSKLGELESRFEAVITGDQVLHGKPAPDIFLLAAKTLGFATNRCLILEDSHNGLAAAQAAGIYAIMVPDLLAPHAGISHVCQSLHEVQAWLKNQIDI